MSDFDTDISFTFATLQESLDYSGNYVDAYTDSIDLPFKGGAVGYINYEAVQDLAGIEPRNSSSHGNYQFVFTRTLIAYDRSEEHTSELQSRFDIVCRLLLEIKNF